MGILPLKTTPARGRETASDGPAARRGPARWASLAGPTLKRLDLPLIAITGIAAFLRLWDLGRVGLRGDEAVYAGQAAVLAGAKGFSQYFILIGRGNSNFLLFQEILSVVYRVTGVGDVTARVVAASFSVLTVLVTYWIAATLFGRRTGLLSALLLAVSAYSVSLGRLALLDSVLTFFFCAAMLCAVKWISTRHSGWLYGFAATAALTLQAKVPGGLVLLVLAGYLLLARSLRELTLRRVLVAAAVFIAALTPALVQLAINGSVFLEFLSTSVRRGSDVPWYYYGQVLVSYEGPLMLALWITGIAFAIGRRSRADALLLLWLLAVIGFYELYPLKAFNYLLPAIPALSILSGRALGALLQWLEEHIHWPRARTLRLPGRAPGDQLQWLKEHIHWPRARTLRLPGRAPGDQLQWLKEHIHWPRARTLRLPGRAPSDQLQWLKEHIHWPRARTLRLPGRAPGDQLQWLKEHIHWPRARTLRLPGRAPGDQLQWLKEHIHWPLARNSAPLSWRAIACGGRHRRAIPAKDPSG